MSTPSTHPRKRSPLWETPASPSESHHCPVTRVPLHSASWERRALGHLVRCLGPTAPRSGRHGWPPAVPPRAPGRNRSSLVLGLPQPPRKEVSWASSHDGDDGNSLQVQGLQCLASPLSYAEGKPLPHLADGETQAQRSRGHTTSKGLTAQAPVTHTHTTSITTGWERRGGKPIQDPGTPDSHQAPGCPPPTSGITSWNQDSAGNTLLAQTRCRRVQPQLPPLLMGPRSPPFQLRETTHKDGI